MLNELVLYTESIVLNLGSLGVFLAAILEEVIFIIPSPIVPMAAGFFLISPGVQFINAVGLSFLYIAIPVSFGLAIGSLFPYYICYFGGRPAIDKWGRLMGLNWEIIEKTEKKFIKGHTDEFILFSLRALPIVPSVAVSSFCGFIRYPVFNFFITTVLGSAVRGIFLGLIGWKMGEAYSKYAGIISEYEKYLFAIVLLISILIFSYLFLKKKSEVK